MTTPISDVDSSSGFEISGSTRKIVVSRNPTDVGIAGLADIVWPEFPEFTFGATSNDLLSVALSDVDSSTNSDSVASRSVGGTDFCVGSDLGTQGNTISDIDSSVSFDSLVGRAISFFESVLTTDITNLTIVLLSDVDSTVGTDLGTQSYGVTSLDSSVITEVQNVGFPTSFTSVDSVVISENQVINTAISDVDSSTGTDYLAARVLVSIDSAQESEVTGRAVIVPDQIIGFDIGIVSVVSADSCVTSDSQAALPMITSVDTMIMSEANNPLALGTTNESIVGFDTVGARAIISFDSSQTTDVVGNRTVISVDSIQESDSGIHGNFVFDRQTIQMSEANNPPAYSPASSDLITGTGLATVAAALASMDNIVLSDNQNFTAISRDSSVMSESAVVGSVSISNTESIVCTDRVGARAFNSTEQSMFTEFNSAMVSAMVIDLIQTTDTPILFVPITQADRTAGHDSSNIVSAKLVDSNPVAITDAQSFVYKPLAIDTGRFSETESVVENPPNFNATITVTDSIVIAEQAHTAFLVSSNQTINMSENQKYFARIVTTENTISLAEQQSVVVSIIATDMIVLKESSTPIAAMSVATDSVYGMDNQNSGPVGDELIVTVDTESVVKYVSLNIPVWAYGEVSVVV